MTRFEHVVPGITLVQDNSRNALNDLATENWRASLIVCDPPFGIRYENCQGRKVGGDEEDPKTLADWSIKAMANVLMQDAPMFVCSRDDVAPAVHFAMRANGLSVKPNIIWDKGRGSGAGNCLSTFMSCHETILFAHKGKPKFREWTDNGRHFPNQPGRIVRRDEGMWRYPVPKDAVARRHLTPKPPKMFERAILPFTAPGDWVLDPFMGGAPVGIACLWTGRRYIGIERDTECFELALANLHRAVEERNTMRLIKETKFAA